MEALFKEMLKSIQSGMDLVLCSIIASSGSTPRGSGAKMAVFADGRTFGTVGGGAVEYESIQLAKQALSEKRNLIQDYNLAANETADIGMICGGKVVVHFHYFSGGCLETIKRFEEIYALYQSEQDAWLITTLSGHSIDSLAVYVGGKGLTSGGAVPLERIEPHLKSKGVLLKEEPSYYIEPLTEMGRVYLFGGGHVSQELVPVISHLGFKVTVFEDRPDFASFDLFPEGTQLILGEFSNINASIQLKPSDYVIIMTRGHQGDYLILEQVLRQTLFYVGVIGSRHKKVKTFERLMAAGIEPEVLEQVHTPIGLEIFAETPAEIAISIAGELILCRAQKKRIL